MVSTPSHDTHLCNTEPQCLLYCKRRAQFVLGEDKNTVVRFLSVEIVTFQQMWTLERVKIAVKRGGGGLEMQ
jgi:hypothetical protein